VEEDAAKWRTISVSFLEKVGGKNFDAEVAEKSRDALGKILERLSCALREPGLKKKLNGLVETAMSKAIAFGQLIAAQRTVYEVCVPEVAGLTKEEGLDLTNVDEDFEGPTEEESGEVLYVGYPGLMKWGNSVGQRMTEAVVLINPFVVLKK
jgi:hypothetical protein